MTQQGRTGAVPPGLGRLETGPPVPPAVSSNLQCKYCFHTGAPELSWQITSDYRAQLRADCSECERWIKYVPQVEPWLDMVEPRPELHQGHVVL